MRSRYSAFVLERAPYLLATWHASTRPVEITFDPGVKWLGLKVRSHTQQDATHAQVEFIARQKPAHGPAVRLRERSRFVLEDGRWVYVDGEAL
jgi:SEC-C motif-containing protein